MLTVHHLEASRSHRILWLLEELGVAYTLKTWRRDKATRLAPPALKKIHPLGKSPVIDDDGEVVAESGAIIEYLAEKYGKDAAGDLANLQPRAGTAAHRQCRFWMHYAEGSLMNWLLMKLVFQSIPKQKMPFFARPVARAICAGVQEKLVDPNLETARRFIEDHLGRNAWFAGKSLTIADFQMCFAVEALLARGADAAASPNLAAWRERVAARPAYRRALEKGGPVILAA